MKLFKNRCLGVNKAFVFSVALMGILYIFGTGLYIYKINKQKLMMRAKTSALLFKAEDVESLSGSKNDIKDPIYLNIKDKLTKLHAVNPDTRFAYLNGERKEKIFFYADSEASDSEDYSPPGQEYPEASDIMHNIFQNKTENFEITRDRWGIWVSALAPIIDPANGKVVAILGMDISAWNYIYDVVAYVMMAFLFVALILVLYISQCRIAKNIKLTEDSLAAKNLELDHMSEVLAKKRKEEN